MTEQLLFPVSWSTQYNPTSVILFSNKTYTFHFSGLLISILPKNQAAPIEIVISDFFRILKTFIAFVSL